jgi:hypothetical protein
VKHFQLLILAIHTLQGHSGVSNVDGNMLNMYWKITISFVGYESQVYNEVYLELGKPLILDAQLNDVSQQLTEVKVTGSKNVFGNGKNRCRNYYWRKE